MEKRQTDPWDTVGVKRAPGLSHLPEVAGCCHLPDEYGKSREDGAVSGARGVQLQQVMQVTAEQVQLCGLEVLRGFHSAPDLLGDL